MGMREEFLRRLGEGERVMWEVGEELGVGRGETEGVVLGLVSEGLVEIVSLSGKVRLTEEGRRVAEGLGGGGGGLGEVVERIRREVEVGGDMEVDLGCLELQLKRSRPLKPVVSACVKALRQALERVGEPRALELARALVEASS